MGRCDSLPHKLWREVVIMIEFINKRNPVLPVEYHIPDAEAHVMSDGKLYVYGSFDNKDGAYCCEKYYVVSTPDMEHWTIHDQAMSGESVSWFYDSKAIKYPGLDWSHPSPFIQKVLAIIEQYKDNENVMKVDEESEKKPILFAPDCIEKNGKYYLYFCLEDESEGVALSDRPEGPFEQLVQLPCGGIDPAVFTDDDGQTYYYWGQVHSHGVKLNEDMISFEKENVVDNLVTEEEHFFHEGSSMRKINDTYYYLYTDIERGKPTALGYATSKNPLGPFTYQGIIIDNEKCDPASWNNHGSIECVNGKWYIFYHRCSRSMPQYRRLCIEPITINKDGTIDEVIMTSQGAGEPFKPGETIMGYQACELEGTVYIGPDEQYGEKLKNISDGDEAVFRYVKSEQEYSGVDIIAAGTGNIEVMLDGESAGIVKIMNGRQMSNTIHKQPGEYEVRLIFREVEKLEIMALQFHKRT